MSFPRRSDLMRMAEVICHEAGVPVPSLRFLDKKGLSYCEVDHLLMPTPEWVEQYHGLGDEIHGEDPEKVATCYQITLIHELAHWIERWHIGDTSHSPFMYATFFKFVERMGFDLEFAQVIERSYKPRASRRGWVLFQKMKADAEAVAA